MVRFWDRRPVRFLALSGALLAASNALSAKQPEFPTEEQFAWLKQYAPNKAKFFSDGIWISAGIDVQNNQYYLRFIDVYNILPQGGKVWVRVVAPKGKAAPYTKSMTYYQFDCTGNRIGTASIVLYNQKGDTTYNWSSAFPNMDPVTPDSMGEHLLNAACWR